MNNGFSRPQKDRLNPNWLGYSFISSMLPGHQGKWEYVENHSLLETNAAGVEGRETLSNRSSNLISMLSNEDDLMFLLFTPEGTVYFSLGEIYNININVDSKSFEVKASRITTADYMLAIFPTDELIEAMKTGNQIVINAQHRKFIFTLNGSKEAITKVVENK